MKTTVKNTMYMKKTLLLFVSVVCCLSAGSLAARADVPVRPMLEQGKTWVYVYHHFEDTQTGYDESQWLSFYTLNGDTVIGGRTYMKMYRWDDRNWKKKYYGAFREDEEGRVYMYGNDGDQQDFLLLDFSLHFGDDRFPDVTRIAETIRVNGKDFRRYRYQGKHPDGSTYDMSFIGIEGVGFQGKGLVHYLYEPEPDCICDFEELNSVECNSFCLSASAFAAPKVIELTDGEQQLVRQNNDFAFNLFRRVRGEKSSIVSPLSITFALGMMNNGAAGQTQQEICQTLGFTDADATNAFCRKMLTEAGSLDAQTKALIANTVFVNEGQGIRLQEGFVQKANEFYDAEPQGRDFLDGQTMDAINQWASDHTEGFIQKVVDADNFNPLAVSYLLNALYFKGAWAAPFDAAETREEPFGDGPVVPMMHKEDAEFSYMENDLYQAVSLPYGNGAYQMSIFLPREGKTVGDVADVLSAGNWQVYGRSCEIDLKLPRFETENTIGLADVMPALGMPRAFTEQAEFPYFCNWPVYIGAMWQVARIRLDEQGTEAAAVTVIGVETTSLPEITEFHATRPFIYVISEQSTGAIFFIGQYTGGVTVAAPTGIAATGNTSSPEASPSLYSLSGQRMRQAPAHGLYIRNGKVMGR